MAGTIVGVADAYVSSAYLDSCQAQFPLAVLYYFFQKMVAQGYCTFVATNYGREESTRPSWGGPSGTGFDSYQGPNPAGENAWFVVKFNTSAARPGGGSQLGEYYCLFQWAGDDSFGTNNNASPGGTDGYPAYAEYWGSTHDGIGWEVAFRLDGGNPFNGGALLVGSDTAASVDTSVNNTLRCRVVGAGSYEVITVTAGATTPKTTIRDDLNTYFTTNNIKLLARVESNKLYLHGTECNGVDIDTFASGSTLNTPVGFLDGATINSNIGADTKGLPVWTDGGTGGLRNMHVANGPYGNYATNKEAMFSINVYTSTGGRRWHAMGDEDGFFLVCDETNQKAQWQQDWMSVSLYEPFSKYPCSYPLIVMHDEGGLPPSKGEVYGRTDAYSSTTSGGMVGPDSLSGNINEVGRVVPHNYPGAMDTSGTFNPIDYLSSSSSLYFWECPTFLEYYDVSGNNHYFMQGSKSFMSEVYGPGPATISADGTRIFISDGLTFPEQRVAFLWAGGWPPGYRSRTYPPGYQVP